MASYQEILVLIAPLLGNTLRCGNLGDLRPDEVEKFLIGEGNFPLPTELDRINKNKKCIADLKELCEKKMDVCITHQSSPGGDIISVSGSPLTDWKSV